MALQSGGTPSKKEPSYWGGTIPWASCKDMKILRLHDTQDHITVKAVANGAKIIPEKSILIVVRGMILAKEFPVAETQVPVSFNQDLKALHPQKNLYSRYLLYWLLANEYEIKGIADEAAHGTKRIQTDRLLNLEIKIPPLPVQHRIASILSTYDDLIENNSRRIAILEEMARRIYIEWFIHFRFPGHEKVKMLDSELGSIPMGWELANILSLTDIRYGKNLPTKLLSDEGPYPVYGAAKIIGRYKEYTRKNRTIITGCRGSVGKIAISKPECFVTNNAFTFDPKFRELFFFLFHALSNRGFDDVIGGSAQPQITLQGISKIKLFVPPKDILTRYHLIQEPFFKFLWLLEDRNEILRQTRDLLLPKLISGEIDVSEMEIAA